MYDFSNNAEKGIAMNAEEAVKLTISEITTDHYLPEKRARRRPNTVYGYESSINLHVLPRWGDVALGDVTHDAVQDWVDGLCASAGPGGAEKAYKCLRQVIRWAMDKWGVLMVDPTRKIKFERRRAYQPAVLTQRRLKKLIRGLVGCEHEATGVLQASVGCRPSEAYCIRWEQINWRTGCVRISGSLHELPGNLYESQTKTAKGDRHAWLPPWALERLHAIWVAKGRPKGRIIGDTKPSKVFRTLKKWAAKHRLPWVGMKNLRHTWGTIAAKNNPIEAVSAMMGHSNIQTTYRYYYQLTLATIRRVQRRVARSILGKTSDDMYKGINIVVHGSDELPLAA